MSEDNDNDNNIKSSRGKVSEVAVVGEDFKLPRLVAPQSRGRIFNRKENNKAPTYLPSINDEGSDEKNFRQTAAIHITRSENDITLHEALVSDPQQLSLQDKLNIMMHSDQKSSQFQTGSNFINNEDELSDDLQFEQKILQNKQIIKMHRKIMNEPISMLEKRKVIDGGMQRGIENRTKLVMVKPQTNYEKKMKQYHLSLENKYLQRKKQSLGIIPEKIQKQQQQQPFEKVKSKKTIPSMQQAPMIKQIKSNFGYGKFKNSAVTKSQAREGHLQQQHASGGGKRSGQEQQLLKSQRGGRPQHHHLSIKQSHKSQQPLNQPKKTPRTNALFDNIQNFLQNPTAPDKHQKFYKQLFSKLKTKSLTQLQEQLKQINQKLGPTNQNFDTKQTLPKEQNNANNSEGILLTENPMERTVRDWKRVDITSKTSLKCKESDFQKQLEYISYLQERNSASLKKFVQQQKLMLELKFNKKFNKNNSPQAKPLVESKAKVVVSQQYVEQAPQS